MNSKLLLILITITILSSCTTSYKTGQTPDDVYFSPVRYQRYDTIQNKNNGDNTVYNGTSNDYDRGYRVNHRRWRRYHDYDYNDYSYYPNGTGTTVYLDPKTGKSTTYTQPRRVNPGAYKRNPPPTVNIKTGQPERTQSTSQTRTFRTTTQSNTQGTGVGNFLRRVFEPGNNSSSGTYGNSNNSTNGNSTTTNTNSTNNSNNSNTNSGSSGTSGSGGSTGSSTTVPVRKFGN